MSEYLTLEQELALAAPLSFDEDDVAGVCDIRSCGERAETIVPGAVLCGDRSRRYGVELDRTYNVPLDDLFAPDFVEVRRVEYEEHLVRARARKLVPATPEKTRLIADLVRQRLVDA